MDKRIPTISPPVLQDDFNFMLKNAGRFLDTQSRVNDRVYRISKFLIELFNQPYVLCQWVSYVDREEEDEFGDFFDSDHKYGIMVDIECLLSYSDVTHFDGYHPKLDLLEDEEFQPFLFKYKDQWYGTYVRDLSPEYKQLLPKSMDHMQLSFPIDFITMNIEEMYPFNVLLAARLNDNDSAVNEILSHIHPDREAISLAIPPCYGR